MRVIGGTEEIMKHCRQMAQRFECVVACQSTERE